MELPPLVAEADVCIEMGLSGQGWYPQQSLKSPALSCEPLASVSIMNAVQFVANTLFFPLFPLTPNIGLQLLPPIVTSGPYMATTVSLCTF